MTPPDQLLSLEDMAERQRQQDQALASVLDAKMKDPRYVLVQQAKMGSTPSYHAARALRWINKEVKLFSALPLLSHKIDPKGNFIIDEESVALLEQRAPNWARQYPMVRYLAEQPDRKFPAILVVVSAPWVDNDDAPEWDAEHLATRDSLDITFLDGGEQLGLLDLHGTTLYVIDGQHRLIAIQGIEEIESTHAFVPKSAGGNAQHNKRMTEVELHEAFGVDEINATAILNETMGVEFVPAVMKGENREEARIRIRRIFEAINLTAQPLSLGEAYTISESDGFAILGKHIGLGHPLFKKDKPGDRINWKTSGLPAKSLWLTTFATLRDVAFGYLGTKAPYDEWRRKRKEVARRPSDSTLEAAEAEMRLFWDQVAELPVFVDIRGGGSIDEWRQFKTEKTPDGKGHLLLRPLGQMVLADALGKITGPDGPKPAPTLDELFKKLTEYDKSGGFTGVHTWESVWHGITFNPSRETMNLEGRATAVLLLRHLLVGLPPSEEAQLAAEFRSLRTLRISDDDVRYINYDGKEVEDEADVQLPPQI